MSDLKAIDILHAEMGAVRSRKDGSVSFAVETPELRPSESGALMQLHGKAIRCLLVPEADVPAEALAIDNEKLHKTPSTRMRAVLYLIWENEGKEGTFNAYYERRMDAIIAKLKEKLPPL